jgi:diguanylate cyclase (GGDEF)-like protein
MAGRSLRISSRFALVLVVLVPSLLIVIGVGVRGLQSVRDSADSLYADHQLTTLDVSTLQSGLQDAQIAGLQLLLSQDAAERQKLSTELIVTIAPAVQKSLVTVTGEGADDSAETPLTNAAAVGWADFQTLIATGALAASTDATESGLAAQIEAAIGKATTATKAMNVVEVEQAAQAHRDALGAYRSSVELMLLAGLLGLICSVGVVIWLIRSVLPRTLAYSAFAADVSRGNYEERLEPTGQDELAQLGRVLDELAQRRENDDIYDRHQLDLIDSLQLTEREQEAHELLKRHLERSIAATSITVLNRNNSADRLQAMTQLEANSPLVASLESAKPRSCLAIRKARPHTSLDGEQSLLACSVCSGCPALTTCTPLIVGGEVIGSVLADHAQPLTDTEQRSIREAVTQSAPVIGNLRNLAIAELRAETDSLTGLPNKRAIQDTIRRMVAQASRTNSPLAALMCDLDHFKHVNDQFGHGRGDDVLAAVGAAMTASIRISDFAGRYGGEEFLILLPDTDGPGAVALAEKVRAMVAAIRVPTVDRPITLSVGIAVLPEHALDSDDLERAADRALYSAKNAGRDRVELFTVQQALDALDRQPIT